MAGIIRLYAAILQTPIEEPVPAGQLPPIPTYFRPAAGWDWLVRLLRPPLVGLEPTPLLLDSFLSTAGFALSQAFGSQFDKLVRCLLEEGIYHNRAGFASASRPTIVKLELTLEAWRQSGHISMPTGRQMDVP